MNMYFALCLSIKYVGTMFIDSVCWYSIYIFSMLVLWSLLLFCYFNYVDLIIMLLLTINESKLIQFQYK